VAAPGLRIESFPDVHAYLDAVGSFLAAREAEHNLLLGIAGTIRDHPASYPGPKLFLALRDGHRVVAVASRTDPWRVLLSETQRPDAVELFVPASIGHATPLPGVAGPPEAAARFARAFEAAQLVDPRSSDHAEHRLHVGPRWLAGRENSGAGPVWEGVSTRGQFWKLWNFRGLVAGVRETLGIMSALARH